MNLQYLNLRILICNGIRYIPGIPGCFFLPSFFLAILLNFSPSDIGDWCIVVEFKDALEFVLEDVVVVVVVAVVVELCAIVLKEDVVTLEVLLDTLSLFAETIVPSNGVTTNVDGTSFPIFCFFLL